MTPASAADGWRAPGAVVLISCYELGHQPAGLASPLGFLRRAGFAPDALDVSVEPFSPEKVERAAFVGISVPMLTALRIGVAVARRVRAANPRCHICFYGLYAYLNGPHLLENGGDSVIGGEFETALVRLVEALAEGRPASEAPGVGTERRAPPPVREKLAFALPDRAALPPLENYARLLKGGALHTAGYVEASRGCRHLCRHCPIPPVYGGRFFIVPREIVLEDIRSQVQAGARHISFGDPDFLNGPGHSMRILRAMHEEFLDLTFDFTAKVEHLIRHEAQLPEIKEMGCAFIVTAVESLSDLVLKTLEKGHTREDVFRALGAARAAGISLRPSLLPFTPWSGREDYFNLLDFIEAEGLIDEVDLVQLAIRLLIPPGSSLLEHPDRLPDLGPLNPENFTYEWAHPDPRMDRLQEAVLALVEEEHEQGADPAGTFFRIRALAADMLGAPERAESAAAPPSPGRSRPPRLTESWFC